MCFFIMLIDVAVEELADGRGNEKLTVSLILFENEG